MTTRLAKGGMLIDRSRPLSFTFNGKHFKGFQGDTLASALLANGQSLVGRSFKYHRPRGVVASGPEEPNALVGLGERGRFEPNQRATTTELFEGLAAVSQNHWPSLEFDAGAISAGLARFFPAGFYYKTFLQPRAAWKHLFEPAIRRSAGLGRPPAEPDADRYEYFYAFVDLLVVGGGIAGLTAARIAAEAGARVLLVEQAPHWGGRALADGIMIDGRPAQDWIKAELAALAAMPNVNLRTRMMAAGLYDHGYVLAYERLSDHRPGAERPRHRLWRIRARRILTATGAIERPLAFAGNDLPGVMLASAIRDHVALWGVSPGDRTIIVTNNDDAYRTATLLRRSGLEVPAILDARPPLQSQLVADARAQGIRVEFGRGIASVKGSRAVAAVEVCAQAGEGAVLETVPCDAVAMSGGWSPAVHLWSHPGGKLLWDEARAMFRPDPARAPTGEDGAPFVLAAGSANGELLTQDVLADALAAGRRVAEALGRSPDNRPAPATDAPAEADILPVWRMPQGASRKLRTKAFLDFQNDVKVSDIELAAQEGYESVEHAKRYTTL
ncbi:MAG TPA: FAD-dependent oxidoreductase, partial [Paracoccaceae bacterium]|nr:FAD-dependent oxidoreductase [Paracoccaceae bacterium]